MYFNGNNAPGVAGDAKKKRRKIDVAKSRLNESKKPNLLGKVAVRNLRGLGGRKKSTMPEKMEKEFGKKCKILAPGSPRTDHQIRLITPSFESPKLPKPSQSHRKPATIASHGSIKTGTHRINRHTATPARARGHTGHFAISPGP